MNELFLKSEPRIYLIYLTTDKLESVVIDWEFVNRLEKTTSYRFYRSISKMELTLIIIVFAAEF